MTALFFKSVAALAAVLILLVGPLILRYRGKGRMRAKRNVARRLVNEVRREYVGGTLEERRKVPAKVAFIRRYCADNGIALDAVGASNSALDRILKVVDLRSPDEKARMRAGAQMPLGETVLETPDDEKETPVGGMAAAEADEEDRSGVRQSAAPKSGPRRTPASLPADHPAASEFQLGLLELGDDGIDTFIEEGFKRITMRP